MMVLDIKILAKLVIGLALFGTLLVSRPAQADDLEAEIFSSDDAEGAFFAIEDTLNQRVEVASGMDESLRDAPATIVVISRAEIRERGYTSIDEVLVDLPGFDTVVSNGTHYVTAYQRGYRTPFTQRVLFLLDGQVDNNLWSHVAAFSRQYPMTNIERIEVMYGPAAAIYGANAFAGIVNVVTTTGAELADGTDQQEIHLGYGSFNTYSIDSTTRGHHGDFYYSLAGRLFQSDEPDLSDRTPFLASDLYADRDIWGPILARESLDESLGSYKDPTDDYGFQGSVGYGDTRVGFIHWLRSEAYGAYYAADRAQNNVPWNNASTQYYLDTRRKLLDGVTSRTRLHYRTSQVSGRWVEATPDWNPGMEQYSYISDTNWNSLNSSMGLRQRFHTELDRWTLSSGFRVERKRLTKAYDIPGYWTGAYSTAGTGDDMGPHGYGSHIGHSTDGTYVAPPLPNGKIPADNAVVTTDVGGYVQSVLDLESVRLSAGLRADHNSVYGATLNPRVAAIYKPNEVTAFKLLYGEAYQEPAPIQLYGGWEGRVANPDLRPEKARNAEAVVMVATGPVVGEVSAFFTHYSDVIKEEAENAGTRNIMGAEFRTKFEIPTFIPNSPDIRGHANLTATRARSSVSYNHDAGEWENRTTMLGDVAPVKVNAGLTVPVMERGWIHLAANFVSKRTLYSRNPLRDQRTKLKAYAVAGATAGINVGDLRFMLKIRNLFNRDYFHPGVEGASAGTDGSQRSLGFQNSVLPQPGRSLMLTIGLLQ
jgi:outer membrane receptor for ferrienterochelin and colicins